MPFYRFYFRIGLNWRPASGPNWRISLNAMLNIKKITNNQICKRKTMISHIPFEHIKSFNDKYMCTTDIVLLFAIENNQSQIKQREENLKERTKKDIFLVFYLKSLSRLNHFNNSFFSYISSLHHLLLLIINKCVWKAGRNKISVCK